MNGFVINAASHGGLDPNVITQESGDSPNLIMSQKAVTEFVNSMSGLGGVASLYIPTYEQTLVYTGKELTPEFSGYSEEYLEISGRTSAVAAGKYKVGFMPRPGYAWLDGTRTMVEVEWEIHKAPGFCELSLIAANVIKGSSAAVTVERHENAAVTVASADRSIADGTISGGVITILGARRGATVMTVQAAETANYKAASAELPVVVNEVAQKPAQSGTLTFDGSVQSPEWNGHSLDLGDIILGGTTSAVNAGKYSATFTLADGRCWPDGSTDPIAVEWEIHKAAGTLSVSESSILMLNVGETHPLTVTCNTDGTLQAVSSDDSVIKAAVEGNMVTLTAAGYGSAEVTISVSESVNYTTPVPVTCTASVIVKTDMTPQQIKQIVDAGQAAEFFDIGDLTPLIPLNGTVAGQVFDNYKVRFRVVHFDDGHPIFQLAKNEAGQEISLVHTTTYGSYVDANGDGFCMNRKGQVGNAVDSSLDTNAKNYGPNKGGWKDSYCRNTLMAQLLACFPAEWQNIIRLSTIWTDNTGNVSNAASNITSTQDKLYLPGEVEMFGTVSYSNGATNTKQEQWDWYKAGNSTVSNRHDQPTVACVSFERDPYRGGTYSFCVVSTSGSASTNYAAILSGLRPAFSI